VPPFFIPSSFLRPATQGISTRFSLLYFTSPEQPFSSCPFWKRRSLNLRDHMLDRFPLFRFFVSQSRPCLFCSYRVLVVHHRKIRVPFFFPLTSFLVRTPSSLSISASFCFERFRFYDAYQNALFKRRPPMDILLCPPLFFRPYSFPEFSRYRLETSTGYLFSTEFQSLLSECISGGVIPPESIWVITLSSGLFVLPLFFFLFPFS